MKIKLNRTRVMLALLVVVASVVVMVLANSCNDSEGATGSLQLRLEDEVSRTIMPSATLMEIAKYSVSGTGPGGAEFGPVLSTESTVGIRNLVTGKWVLTAKALNIQNNEVSSGTAEVEVSRGENSATVVLDTMAGNGSMELDFSWDSNISLDLNMNLLISIQDSDGAISMFNHTVRVADGFASFVRNMRAGCYIMSVQVQDSRGSLGIGATDAVRIIANTRSYGDIELVSGGSGDVPADGSVQVTLRNDIGSPLPFYIDYSPKNPEKGASVTLRARCDCLPEGTGDADYLYQWYRNGELIRSGKKSVITVEAVAGNTRYDVIVGSIVDGTLCGATLSLNVPE